MTLSAQFALLHSDLTDFLFAPVGDQQNGMTLNVVSALTRLDIDPWKEAERLASLPTPAAAEALAPLIARLPIERGLRTDLEISRRLVALLPLPQQATQSDHRRLVDKDKRYFYALMLLVGLALGAAVVTAIL